MAELMLMAIAAETKLFSPEKLMNLAEAAIYSLIGALLFVGLFWLTDKLTPYSLWKEIIEEHNNALAILLGSCAIGLGIIIGAAIVG